MFNLEDYETVEERLAKFWKDHPDGQIHTKLLDHTSGRFIVEASIFRTEADSRPWTTGLAEETVQGRGVNATSALENCETSAIGRALANAGYATKGKRASREEMSKVAAKEAVVVKIQEVKQKMAQTAEQYVPVQKADDPWTQWEAAPVQTMEQAVETVKSALGGIAVEESCQHGARIWRTGTSKQGKPYGAWYCAGAKDGVLLHNNEKCDPHWYEIDKETGQWKPQVKRG
jgi:signal recognition particle subunit SEC65